MPNSPRFRVGIVDWIQRKHLETADLEAGALADVADVELLFVDTAKEILQRAGELDCLISWHGVALPVELFRALNRCRGIVRAAVGYDDIDLASAAAHGIPIFNVPDYGTEEVADHALLLILALRRNLTKAIACTQEGRWDWGQIAPAPRLRGSRLGIVGLGRIGTAVARRASAFGLRTCFFDPYQPDGTEKALGIRRSESLHELIADSDILSLHVPLSTETRELIGKEELALLQPGACLVNTSRGEVIDQEALLAVVRENRIGGVALDVLADEPQVPPLLIEAPNVILTPHCAFYSEASLPELRMKTAEKARALLLEQPIRSCVNSAELARASARVPATQR